MVGITLSVDEIKAAPLEVRRRLEHEIAHAFGGLPARAPASTYAMVGCNVEEARDMLRWCGGCCPR